MKEICVGDNYDLMSGQFPAYHSERILVIEVVGDAAVCKMLDWYGTYEKPFMRIPLKVINAFGKKL